MIEVKAELTDISINYKNGKIRATFEYEGKPEEAEELQGKELDLKVKKHYERRSRDANSYFWVLCGKLASKINLSKRDIYRGYIPYIPDNCYDGYVRDKDAYRAKRDWERNGIGWIADVEDDKKGWKHITYYEGSSVYTTEQMSILLDLIISDCEQVGISTLTPNEIEQLKERWGNEAV